MTRTKIIYTYTSRSCKAVERNVMGVRQLATFYINPKVTFLSWRQYRAVTMRWDCVNSDILYTESNMDRTVAEAKGI